MQKKDLNQAYRPNLEPQVAKELMQIANRFQCMHGRKPSIKRLLNKIASGELWVTEDPLDRNRTGDSSTICFYITVPRYLKGTIAILSKEIAKYKGNIRRVETSTTVKTLKEKVGDHLGILHIFIHFEDEDNLSKLVSALMNIKAEEVKKLNEKEDIGKLVEVFRKHGELIGNNSEDRLENFLDLKIVRELKCIVGFRITVKDNIGVLAKITQQIASAKILIHSINQGKHRRDSSFAVLEIFVYLKSLEATDSLEKISDLSKQIDKISTVEKEFKKIESVIKIERMEVSSYH